MIGLHHRLEWCGVVGSGISGRLHKGWRGGFKIFQRQRRGGTGSLLRQGRVFSIKGVWFLFFSRGEVQLGRIIVVLLMGMLREKERGGGRNRLP